MKNLFLIVFLYLNLSTIFAQDQIIRPKKGEIVFSSKLILDKANYKKEMDSALIQYAKTAFGSNADSVISHIKSMTPLFESINLDSLKDHFHHVHEDSLIRAYQTQNNKIISDFTVINKKNSTSKIEARIDKSIIVRQPESFMYENNENVIIEEYKDETKIISGFKCFRVLYKYKFSGDDSWMSSLSGTTELWVTESIQSLFHPVCRVKEILLKYYPLEIIERSDALKSMVTHYKTVSISLSN